MGYPALLAKRMNLCLQHKQWERSVLNSACGKWEKTEIQVSGVHCKRSSGTLSPVCSTGSSRVKSRRPSVSRPTLCRRR
jgi:hypothetical protein